MTFLVNYVDFGFVKDSPPTSPGKCHFAMPLQASAVFSNRLPSAGSSPVVYQHVRELSGIVDSLSAPPKPDDTPLPNLGPLAMSYLHAHGYSTSAILHIYTYYQKSNSPDDFAMKLSVKGLPFVEGKYVWEVIYNGQPDFTFN
jgi:hypothetical protein